MFSPSSLSFLVLSLLSLASASSLSVSTSSVDDVTIAAFPSFASLNGQPYNVSYDGRALTINGSHVLFLSGSVHPPRGSTDDWDSWFTQATQNGLNMVQVYVFWNFHEETEGVFNWQGRGNLTLFVEKAASHGLFVNLRIGPYVCAEWTYGGLPTWLGLKPGVAFRETNSVWQPAMQKWFNTVVDRMADGGFFATQGGPIVLVQVENELPGSDKSYVEWCGTIAHEALDKNGVDVPVTMCNGQTASTAINTCNANTCNPFLEEHGQNGRVLKDQPALWTENEGGFQTWGGAPPPGKEPYFWGKSIADQSLSVMNWFARGGSHMNYYMWVGGNNFGRWTGDAVATMYAVDAAVCPDGLPHEPKFSQMTAMHQAIASVASSIVSNPAQLDEAVKVGSGAAYVYGDVAFLEGVGTVTYHGHNFVVPLGSSSLVNLQTGTTLFNTLTMAAKTPPPARTVSPISGLSAWTKWSEPVVVADVPAGVYPSGSLFNGSTQEMTTFTDCLEPDATDLGARSTRSTFALYETTFVLAGSSPAAKLSVDSTQAMFIAAFVDGVLQGSASDLSHSNGQDITLDIEFDTTTKRSGDAAATHTLTILAEEMGYANYGFKTGLKKGITGSVSLLDSDGKAATLGSEWTMRGGLSGEHLQLFTDAGASKVSWTASSSNPPAMTWLQSTFDTPVGVATGSQKLLFNATGLNRGRVWVNGHDAGRYFLDARNDGSACPGAQPAPAPAGTCPDPSVYNNSAPYTGAQCDGLQAVPAGNPSAKQCLTECCAQGLETWQWGDKPATGPGGGGCWCGACRGALVPNNDWVGGHREQASCATQSYYYIPRSWLSPAGSANTITLFESGGLSGSGFDIAQATLAVASMQQSTHATADDDILTSVVSCEF